MDLKENIINYSTEVGISIIGFTNPKAIMDVKERLIKRRELNKLCGLEEKDIESRISIQKKYPWAKTIITIGIGYNTKEDKVNDKFYGYICKSGYIRDYHRVVEERAQALVDYIRTVRDTRYIVHVDKGPLVDREAAFQSGIGWYGKNCCIISPILGSWFVIGQIVTDLELELDSALDTDCGDCRLCIDACPAGALEGDYTMDASKCLSYLTQRKEELSPEERRLMGNRLYGCDTCQIVCPHNRDKYIEDNLLTDNSGKLGNLLEILTMSNKEFNQIYKETGSGWRGKKIMQRNALIILENMGTIDVVEALEEVLRDRNHPLRDEIQGVVEKIQKRLR